jgi:methylated-DNA-[protein]-cysteine S-methyltransferase
MKSLTFNSPIGKITVFEERGRIVRIKIGGKARVTKGRQSKLLVKAQEEILQYLSGRRKVFTLPYSLKKISKFQLMVLETVKNTEYGSWTTYGEIVKALGQKRAARAVGQALKRNPLPLLIPCHRVKRANGDLGGFSGGGREVKKFLLDLERRNSFREGF